MPRMMVAEPCNNLCGAGVSFAAYSDEQIRNQMKVLFSEYGWVPRWSNGKPVLICPGCAKKGDFGTTSAAMIDKRV